MNEEVEEIIVEEPDYTVAEVAGVYSDGLTLIFPGAEEASEKHYKCNADVVFHVGDRVKITKDGDTYIVDCVIGNPAEPSSPGIPSGGLSGTFLGKNSGTSYDVSWKAIHELPNGGTTDQVLAKNSNTAYDTKWITPTHDIASGGTANQFLAKNSATDYDTKWVNAPVPTGGTAGQVLAKKTATNYDTEWVSQSGLPTGGTTGQVLTKKSATNYDAQWSNSQGLPTGGTAGQVLTKDTSTAYDASWQTPAHELPTGGTSGQVLTKNSATNYDVKWAAVTATSTNSVANYYSASSALNTAYNIYFKTDATYNPSKLYWRMGTSGTWHQLS